MRNSRLSLHLALVLLACSPSSAGSREGPICDPPTVSFAAHGQTFNGIVCRGAWGCSCTVRFCPSCPLSAQSCSLTNCTNLPRPRYRAAR